MSVRRVVERIAEKRLEIVREAVRIDSLALDQARVAERRLEAGLALVDEHYRASPLLQMQGGGHADDAGAENDHVVDHRNRPSPACLPPPGVGGSAKSGQRC